MMERLQKFLSRAGVASRRAAEVLILEGKVTVNGKVVRTLGTKVDGDVDEVRVSTERVRAPHAPEVDMQVTRLAAGESRRLPPLPDGAVYLMMNKPEGVLSTVKDDRGRPTVMDLLPRTRQRVFPVGRLDVDSGGLLLLTSDGNLTQLLTHPKFEVPKTYDLRVRGQVENEAIAIVERGVWLSEGRTGPAHLRIRRAGRDMSHIVMTLREGRNREVRRIFARLRHPVLSLRRIELGPLRLGDLKPGQVRRLAVGEVKALYAAALFPTEPSPDEVPGKGARRSAAAGAGSRGRRPTGVGSRKAGAGRTSTGGRGPGGKPRRDDDRRGPGKPRRDGDSRGPGKPRRDGDSRGPVRPRRDGDSRGPGAGRPAGERRPAGGRPGSDRPSGGKGRPSGGKGKPPRRDGGGKGGGRPGGGGTSKGRRSDR